MPLPIEICLEDLGLSPDDERYIRCVALPGGEPGLALDHAGLVRWMAPADYGLWVSADDRLILLRAEGAAPITVQRGGRSVEAPEERPVVLLDGDELQVDGRRLRVHVHGEASEVFSPEPLTGRALARIARATAAALALGAMVGAGGEVAAQPGITGAGKQPPVEVRRRPPKPVAPRRRVVCAVASVKTVKGKVVVQASCPEPVSVGAWGQLLDAKGQLVTDGGVVVRKAQGKTISAEATGLKKPVKASQILFRLR